VFSWQCSVGSVQLTVCSDQLAVGSVQLAVDPSTVLGMNHPALWAPLLEKDGSF